MNPERIRAAKRRLKFYDHEHPCAKEGHGTLRYTSNGICVECAKAASRKRAEHTRELLRQAGLL